MLADMMDNMFAHGHRTGLMSPPCSCYHSCSPSAAGFVLLGRALEERAKLQASADMAALQVLTCHSLLLVLFSALVPITLAGELRHGVVKCGNMLLLHSLSCQNDILFLCFRSWYPHVPA
jgi:predicted Kef-type K+ transport protein